jgi:hypothetical protein
LSRRWLSRSQTTFMLPAPPGRSRPLSLLPLLRAVLDLHIRWQQLAAVFAVENRPTWTASPLPACSFSIRRVLPFSRSSLTSEVPFPLRGKGCSPSYGPNSSDSKSILGLLRAFQKLGERLHLKEPSAGLIFGILSPRGSADTLADLMNQMACQGDTEDSAPAPAFPGLRCHRGTHRP